MNEYDFAVVESDPNEEAVRVRCFKDYQRAYDFMVGKLTRRFHKQLSELLVQNGAILGVTADELVVMYQNGTLQKEGYAIELTGSLSFDRK